LLRRKIAQKLIYSPIASESEAKEALKTPGGFKMKITVVEEGSIPRSLVDGNYLILSKFAEKIGCCIFPDIKISLLKVWWDVQVRYRIVLGMGNFQLDFTVEQQTNSHFVLKDTNSPFADSDVLKTLPQESRGDHVKILLKATQVMVEIYECTFSNKALKLKKMSEALTKCLAEI
jgi:hypothetical protein